MWGGGLNFHPLCFITHQINPVSALRLVFVISCRQMLLTAEWSVRHISTGFPWEFHLFTFTSSQFSGSRVHYVGFLRRLDSNYLSINNDSIFKSQNERKKRNCGGIRRWQECTCDECGFAWVCLCVQSNSITLILQPWCEDFRAISIDLHGAVGGLSSQRRSVLSQTSL